jgi:hypothetical protein
VAIKFRELFFLAANIVKLHLTQSKIMSLYFSICTGSIFNNVASLVYVCQKYEVCVCVSLV